MKCRLCKPSKTVSGKSKQVTYLLCSLISAQVSLLDVNDAAGRTLKEALNEQYGQEKTLYFKCDVMSEEQVKGSVHTNTQKKKVGMYTYTQYSWVKTTVLVPVYKHRRGTKYVLLHCNRWRYSPFKCVQIGPFCSQPVMSQLKQTSLPTGNLWQRQAKYDGSKNVCLLTRLASFSCCYLVTRFFFFFCYTSALFGRCVQGVSFQFSAISAGLTCLL